jgi:serine/threonine protein kinase/putative intracellular protease/amidase
MAEARRTHPSPEQLAAFGLGQLDGTAQAEVERHVAGCEHCCQALQAVPDDTLLGKLRAANTSLDGTGFKVQWSPLPSPAEDPPRELANHPRYRVVKLLGAGGMGQVYQAEHRLMGRPVALKVISRELTRHPVAVERFRREVKAAARLSHPNIVTAFDADCAGDLHFLVMEYVEGMSLARVVEKRGALPVAHACNYVRQAALGLAHAHDRGMVHRDIKPHNLMLTRKGQVKVLDFGLARFAQEGGPGGQPPTRLDLTTVGTVVGTPDYMAPEQANNSSQVDIRADIYALGCTLYYLLAGRPPFPEGSSMEKLLAQVEQTPTPLPELRPEVPAALTATLDRMMAKSPGERFQTPAEVADALAPFANPRSAAAETPVPTNSQALTLLMSQVFTPPQLARWGRRRAVGLLLAVVAGCVLAVAVGRREPGPDGNEVEQHKDAVVFAADRPVVPKSDSRPSSSDKGTGPEPTKEAGSLSPAKDRGPVAPAPDPARSRHVLLVLPEEHEGVALAGLQRALANASSVKTTVASSGAHCKPVPWSPGREVRAELVLDQNIESEPYDAVILVGGHIFKYKDAQWPSRDVVRNLLADMLRAGKPVAAVASGQRVLAAHDVLKGRKAALPSFQTAPLGVTDVEWVKQPVVADQHVITAGRPEDAEELVRVLLEQLRSSP